MDDSLPHFSPHHEQQHRAGRRRRADDAYRRGGRPDALNRSIRGGKNMLMRTFIVSLALALTASVAQAHVSVRPRESKAGATERYIIRVPTEGEVATTSVEVDVPQGVIVERFEPADGV